MRYIFSLRTALLYFVREQIISLFVIGVVVYFFHDVISENTGFFIGIFILIELPIVVLFFQYLFNDLSSTLTINRKEGSLIYEKKGHTDHYLLSKIIKIEMIVPPGQANKDGFKIYPQDGYFYYIFSFEGGDELIITSLLLKGKQINPANFKEFDIEKKIKFFPFI